MTFLSSLFISQAKNAFTNINLAIEEMSWEKVSKTIKFLARTASQGIENRVTSIVSYKRGRWSWAVFLGT